MKNAALSIFIFFLSVLLPTSIHAKEVQTKSIISGETVIVEEDEVLNRDYFAAGDTVKVFGTINGDLYTAGGTVIINGTINGDLLVVGGTVKISGLVTQDVRTAGGQIDIDGEVGRNLTAVGGNINLGSSAKILGSAVIVGGNANIDAPIAKNLNAGVGNLTISNLIGGDIEAGLETATLTKSAKVQGDFIYWSEEDATIVEGASVSGVITRNDPRTYFDQKDLDTAKKQIGQFKKVFGGTAKLLSIISTMVTGLILLKLFPKFSTDVADILVNRPLPSLGVGLLTLLGFPMLFILILLTVFGIPIALMLLAFYLIYIYISKLFVLLWAGNYLAKKIDKKMNLYSAFILGLIAYTGITFIPVVGGFIRFFTLIFGLGALVLTCKKTYQEALKKEVV